jgi:1,4-alpha-glucan branching enzyme
MIQKKPVRKGKVKVTFTLPEDHPYGKVSAVGDFNNWDPTAHPFVRRSNKTYSTSAVLEVGQRYAFRYFCEDGSWINDPEADGYEPSGFGSDNGVLLT